MSFVIVFDYVRGRLITWYYYVIRWGTVSFRQSYDMVFLSFTVIDFIKGVTLEALYVPRGY